MENTEILKGYSDKEKGAYLGAIASLATADQTASEEELSYIGGLADAAGISAEQKQMVLRAATELTGNELQKCIDILKTSELRFALITELISFAKSDGQYTEPEKRSIEEMAQQLNIDQKQFSLLDSFVTKAGESNQAAPQTAEQGFLDSLGLGDKFKGAGINMSGLGKGLLSIAAPLLLAKLFMGRRNTNRMGMGNFGTASRGFGGDGFGSVLSALSSGRGYGNTGGLLSKFLSGKLF